MQPFLRLIREAHRRSLWQVLSVYMVGSWIALQVVQAVTQTAGLPDWTPGFAFVLLVIGLPIVLATAFVQEGAPGSTPAAPAPASPADAPPVSLAVGTGSMDLPTTRPKALRRALTWRRAIWGGIGAFVLLFVAVGGYFGMRFLGVGPVASLAAQGLMEEGSSLLLADFRNATPDSLLGSVVTEAMRIDLASSKAFALVERPRIDRVLRLMEREPTERLTADLAREVAIRDGIEAVLEGDVGSAGSGYILSATLRSAEGGVTLATFRRTARSADDVIDAIDKLSQDVREKTGESLRSIKSDATLQDVTTGSLDALRKYTEGERLLIVGDERAGLALLEESVALDSTFSMAWRRIATVVANRGLGREREIRALEAAYRHRERLSERERYLAEAAYHNGVTGDLDAIQEAYENVLRIDPESPQALNNLGNVHMQRGDLAAAETLYRTAIGGRGITPNAFINLTRALSRQAKWEAVDSLLVMFRERYPQNLSVLEARYWSSALRGDTRGARAAAEETIALPAPLPGIRAGGYEGRAVVALMEGKFAAYDRDMDEAARLAGRDLGVGAEVWTRLRAAEFRDLAGDSTGARQGLAFVEQRGLFAATPVEERPWNTMVRVQLGVGDRAGAQRTLDSWRREIPEERILPFDRAEMELFAAWARNTPPAEILQAIEALRRDGPCVRCYRLLEARLLIAAGQPDQARAVLRDLLANIEAYYELNVAAWPAALEQLGALAEQAGDKAEAADAYRRLTEMWKDGDGAALPRLRRARERLAALGT